jgi:hypothetical protein
LENYQTLKSTIKHLKASYSILKHFGALSTITIPFYPANPCHGSSKHTCAPSAHSTTPRTGVTSLGRPPQSPRLPLPWRNRLMQGIGLYMQ